MYNSLLKIYRTLDFNTLFHCSAKITLKQKEYVIYSNHTIVLLYQPQSVPLTNQLCSSFHIKKSRPRVGFLRLLRLSLIH